MGQAVPISLSDVPTVAVKIDPDRTLNIEPQMLAQLCAATQISERKRILPKALEYSVHIQLAADKTGPAVLPAVLPETQPAPKRRARRRWLIAMGVGLSLGLSLGVFAAWRLIPGDSQPAQTSYVPEPSAETPQGVILPKAEPQHLDEPSDSPPLPTTPTAQLPAQEAVAPSQIFPSGPPLPAPEKPASFKPVRVDRRSGSSLPSTPVANTDSQNLLAHATKPGGAFHADTPKALPPALPELDASLSPKRLTGAEPQLPQIARELYRHETVVGTYRVCVQPDGAVGSVTAVAGIPFDDNIQHTLYSWRFAPRATQVCMNQELQFVVDE